MAELILLGNLKGADGEGASDEDLALLIATPGTETEAAVVAVVDDSIAPVQTALAAKADTTTVNSGLATKADATATTTAIAAKAPRGLQSYVPTTVTGTYDPKFNAYNWKRTNTRKLSASLGRAAAGGMAEWMVISDSGGAGCTSGPGGTFDRARAWPMEIGKELARHGVPKAGTGLVRILDLTYIDSRWGSFVGTWTTSSKTYAYLNNVAGSATFTSDVAGDRVQVWTYDGNDGATADVAKNGVSIGTITSTGPIGWRSTIISTPVAVGDAIKITRTTGILGIKGINVYTNNGGLLIHNVSQSGSKASGASVREVWSDNVGVDRLGTVYANVTTTGAPDVVFCALGGNDLQAGTAATNAQIHTALTTIRNRYSTSDFILCAEFALNTTLVAAATYESYVGSLYQLADTLDVPLIDWRARLGDYTTTVANGLTTDGQGHLLAPGYVDMGRNAGMLAAS